jgi:hypothetical protein
MAEPKYLDESFEKTTRELLKIFIKKHRDYGKGNILDTGEMGVLYRVSDKINRLKHLLANKKPLKTKLLMITGSTLPFMGLLPSCIEKAGLKN